MLALTALAIAACSPDVGPRGPSLSRLPLAPHTQVVFQQRVCDEGANSFCAVEEVLAGSGYASPDALLAAETRLLRSLHWRRVNADTGLERAAYSPAGHLRLTYATARGELESVAFGWVQRPHRIAVALAHTLFERTPALALQVEVGQG
jgi:hypothetical protein